ncbi:MAG: carbohydrate-binding family 9-like protein [Planctomycetota bacterium]|nr:carbohydrate-binding family 9-like protein [Planctomycetota bacterium]MDA1178505.1 carbohydrate-binding family 9-like protein [Planctomycetota bacterium]
MLFPPYITVAESTQVPVKWRYVGRLRTFTFGSVLVLWIASITTSAEPTASAAAPPSVAELPHYQVQHTTEPIRIDGQLDEAVWFAAPDMGNFHFPWFQSGKRERTIAKIVWDNSNLYIAHVCEDGHITARYRQHNDPIPEDDCFEIMLAPNPQEPRNYYNIEWNVLGGYIDGQRPQGPQGPRAEWDVEGLRLAGRVVGTANEDGDNDSYWIVEVAIPWKNFNHAMPHTPPEPGDTWRVNLNRHGGTTNMQYSQWSAADTPAPSFHVPHRFGTLEFVNDKLPFQSLSGDDTP